MTLQGWFSAQAFHQFGGAWWSTPGGGEILITSALNEKLSYNWPDKYYVGEVVEAVRRAHADDFSKAPPRVDITCQIATCGRANNFGSPVCWWCGNALVV